MNRSTKRQPKDPGPSPPGLRGRRVLVHLVNERPRPIFITVGDTVFYSKDDVSTPARRSKWEKEKTRREAIDSLLTPGERKFFHAYCRLRDD